MKKIIPLFSLIVLSGCQSQDNKNSHEINVNCVPFTDKTITWKLSFNTENTNATTIIKGNTESGKLFVSSDFYIIKTAEATNDTLTTWAIKINRKDLTFSTKNTLDVPLLHSHSEFSGTNGACYINSDANKNNRI